MAVEKNESGIPCKVIQGCEVLVTPWTFTKLMPRKTYLAGIISKVSKGLGVEDFGIQNLLQIVEMIANHFSEKELNKFIEMMCEGVRVDGFDMTDSSNRDCVFSSRSTLFYDMVAFVLEVNLGDFLERVGLNKIISEFIPSGDCEI